MRPQLRMRRQSDACMGCSRTLAWCACLRPGRPAQQLPLGGLPVMWCASLQSERAAFTVMGSAAADSSARRSTSRPVMNDLYCAASYAVSGRCPPRVVYSTPGAMAGRSAPWISSVLDAKNILDLQSPPYVLSK